MNKLNPTFDKDGDITNETQSIIETWTNQYDWNKFINFIEKCFNKDYGQFQKSNGKLILVTGGWSSNEIVVDAVKKNHLFMGLFWQASFRGGRYEFTLPKATC